MRIKNKISTPKALKEEYSGAYPCNFSKEEKPEICENEIVLIKLIAVRTTFPQNLLGTKADNKKEQAISTMCLCFLSTTLFCSGVSVHEIL
jgi:hypothetical protein